MKEWETETIFHNLTNKGCLFYILTFVLTLYGELHCIGIVLQAPESDKYTLLNRTGLSACVL